MNVPLKKQNKTKQNKKKKNEIIFRRDGANTLIAYGVHYTETQAKKRVAAVLLSMTQVSQNRLLMVRLQFLLAVAREDL